MVLLICVFAVAAWSQQCTCFRLAGAALYISTSQLQRVAGSWLARAQTLRGAPLLIVSTIKYRCFEAMCVCCTSKYRLYVLESLDLSFRFSNKFLARFRFFWPARSARLDSPRARTTPQPYTDCSAHHLPLDRRRTIHVRAVRKSF